MGEFVKYCPRCSKLFEYEESKLNVCDFCATNLIESDISNEAERSRTLEQIVAWRKEIIKTNPLYNKTMHERMKENSILRVREEMSVLYPKCPYCGYDKFQMVAKKWSFWTGFLTNKVDRVCEKCKRRF